MRMFKLIISLLVLAFIALFIYQNMIAFTSPVPFKMSLYGEPTQWGTPRIHTDAALGRSRVFLWGSS